LLPKPQNPLSDLFNLFIIICVKRNPSFDDQLHP